MISYISEGRHWPHTITTAGNLLDERFPTLAVPSSPYEELGFASLHTVKTRLHAFLRKPYIYYNRSKLHPNTALEISQKSSFNERFLIFYLNEEHLSRQL
ncbi:hypothetical protein ANTRET_LOCUS4487 [Anthophora retusa]